MGKMMEGIVRNVLRVSGENKAVEILDYILHSKREGWNDLWDDLEVLDGRTEEEVGVLEGVIWNIKVAAKAIGVEWDVGHLGWNVVRLKVL